MHIYEGVLTATAHGREVLLVGAAAAAAGTALGLYRLDYERIPRAAALSSVFFVASLIHVPLGPTTVHLTLNGLMGLLLGWAAFPALLIALLLQAVFFPPYGGLVTLGLNTTVMALPAVVCHGMFRRGVRSRSETAVCTAGFAAGASGILLGATCGAAALGAAGEAFQVLGVGLLIVNLPLAGLEGLVTASVVLLLRKVRPEVLEAPLLVSPGEEVSGA